MDYLTVALLYLISGLLFVRMQIALGASSANSFHVLLWPVFFLVEILAYLFGLIVRRTHAS